MEQKKQNIASDMHGKLSPKIEAKRKPKLFEILENPVPLKEFSYEDGTKTKKKLFEILPDPVRGKLFSYLNGWEQQKGIPVTMPGASLKPQNSEPGSDDIGPEEIRMDTPEETACAFISKDTQQRPQLPCQGKSLETFNEDAQMRFPESLHCGLERSENVLSERPCQKKMDFSLNDVVTDFNGFMSGNFDLELIAVEKEVDESKQKNAVSIFYIFLIKMPRAKFVKRVPSGDLERIAWLKEATDGLAYFKQRKDNSEFANYVHKIMDRDIACADKKVYFSTNGWKKDGKNTLFYVCDIGLVGGGSDKIRANADLKFQIDKGDNIRNNFDKFYDMQGISIKKEISQTLMVFVSMSVMTTLFEEAGFPIKFIVGLMGTTNTLKTSTGLIFTRIFNALETHSPEVTFSSTNAGIETFVSKYADSILMVDDFMPGENKAKQSELNGKLELLCRLFGDRASKKRMTVFSGKGEIEYPVRGCCLITGEHLTGVESSRTRVLCVDLEKGDINKEALAYYQDNPLVLPTYLYHFIEFLSSDPGRIIEFIKAKVQDYRKRHNFRVARYNEAAAQFLAALDVMAEYWKRNGFLQNIDEIKMKWVKNILYIIQKNDRSLSKISISDIILRALEEEIRIHGESVKPIEEIRPEDTDMIYYDDDFIYVQQKKLYLIAKNYCKVYDHNFFLQQSMVGEKLKESGALECQKNSNGHWECSRKLQQGKGITKRFLYIKIKKIKEALQNEE